MSERSDKLEQRAGAVETVSWWLFGMCGLCLVVAVVKAVGQESAWGAVEWAAGFLMLGWMTNLVGQLIYIRAALERKE